MNAELLLPILSIGAFLASLLGSMFGIGAGLVILLFLSSLYPMTTVVPLIAACLAGTELIRAIRFYPHIAWRIVRPFILGSIIGVMLGSRFYFNMQEWILASVIALIVFIVLWAPAPKCSVKVPNPYFYLGVIHSFISTIFAAGGLFQAAIARAKLSKLEIIATIAASFFLLTTMKVLAYATFGFNYQPYISEIAVTLMGSIPGTLLGARLVSYISNTKFKLIFRIILTLFAMRLLYTAILTFPN